jgi:hypothetical protein
VENGRNAELNRVSNTSVLGLMLLLSRNVYLPVLALQHHFLLQILDRLVNIEQGFCVIAKSVWRYIDHGYSPIDDNILFPISLVV